MLGIAIGIAAGHPAHLDRRGDPPLHARRVHAVRHQHPERACPASRRRSACPGVLGGTTHKLTIDDALAIGRLPGVEAVTPLAFGTGRVERGDRGRTCTSTASRRRSAEVWKCAAAAGRLLARRRCPSRLPDGGARPQAAPRAVRRRRTHSAEFVRIGGTRFRVVGVMEPKGQFLGIDLDDIGLHPGRLAPCGSSTRPSSSRSTSSTPQDERSAVEARAPAAHRAPPGQRGLHHHSPRRRCSTSSATS